MEHSNENLVPSYCIYNQYKIKLYKNIQKQLTFSR